MPAKNKYALSIEKTEPKIWRLFCSRLINSRDIRHLTQEMRLVPDGFKTFFNRDVVVYLIPTPCMTHVGKVESFVSYAILANLNSNVGDGASGQGGRSI